MISAHKMSTNEKAACLSCGHPTKGSWSIRIQGIVLSLCQDCIKKLSSDISKESNNMSISGFSNEEEFFCPFCDMDLEKSQVIVSEDGSGHMRCKRCGTALEE